MGPGDGDGVVEGDAVGLAEGKLVGLADGLADAVDDGLGDGVTDETGDGLALAEPCGDGLGEAEPIGDGDTLPEGDGVVFGTVFGIVFPEPPEPLHCASPTASTISPINPSMGIRVCDRTLTSIRVSSAPTLVSIRAMARAHSDPSGLLSRRYAVQAVRAMGGIPTLGPPFRRRTGWVIVNGC